MKAQINLHRMGRLGHSGWRGWEKQLKKISNDSEIDSYTGDTDIEGTSICRLTEDEYLYQ